MSRSAFGGLSCSVAVRLDDNTGGGEATPTASAHGLHDEQRELMFGSPIECLSNLPRSFVEIRCWD